MTQDQLINDKAVSGEKNASIGIGFVTILCLCSILISTIASYFIMEYKTNSSETPRIVVIDAMRIVQAKTNQMIGSGGNDAGIYSEEGKKFGLALNKIVNDLVASGYIVLNANSVLNNPASVDITKDVAKTLNVDLDYRLDKALSQTASEVAGHSK